MQETFGGIGSATSFISAARTVEWETVQIAEEADVLFNLIRTYRKNPPELSLYDWNDWQSWIFENGVSDSGMNLMVSEQQPSVELCAKLSAKAEGVWSLEEEGRWAQLSVLVYIPRDLELETAKRRADAAREILVQYWNSRFTGRDSE